jgi:hypothetical protein
VDGTRHLHSGLFLPLNLPGSISSSGHVDLHGYVAAFREIGGSLGGYEYRVYKGLARQGIKFNIVSISFNLEGLSISYVLMYAII